ncbi:PO21 protein, partial [Pelecanoides urinatrix]|nr:PO21 protein [Pelecanoides urinatrix]
KAFDNINHSHVIMALKQKGIHDHIIALIKILYHNTNIQIDLKNEQLDPIRIRIGVKQGNAMSPILFNLSVTLYCASWRSKAMCSSKLEKVTTLAFADDLVLLSDSLDGMQKNINIFEVLCELTGLR